MIIFRIPYPESQKMKALWNREYGMNAIYAGKHWKYRQADAAYWHALTQAAIRKAGITGEPYDVPVVITFLWNDRMDLTNHAYMAKMIEDGMKGIIIRDDNPKWVKGVEHYAHEEPYITVKVREKDAG